MYNINEKAAGDFIDLESWYAEISTMQAGEDDQYFENIITKFFISLVGRLFESEEECKQVFENYVKEVEELKSGFEFIYNPPQLPSSTEQTTPSIGDEYRKEFVEMYGGYVELVYLLCSAFGYKPDEVLQMKTQDFLFWANYLLHKKYVENIK